MTTTSASLKYFLINSSINLEVSGTNSESFIIALLPAAKTSINGPSDSEIGKFQGAIMPITPSG